MPLRNSRRLHPTLSDPACANRGGAYGCGSRRATSSRCSLRSRERGRHVHTRDKLVKSTQQSSNLMATHLYSCRACPFAARLEAWNARLTLQRMRPRLTKLHASLRTSGGNAHGANCMNGRSWPSPPPLPPPSPCRFPCPSASSTASPASIANKVPGAATVIAAVGG